MSRTLNNLRDDVMELRSRREHDKRYVLVLPPEDATLLIKGPNDYDPKRPLDFQFCGLQVYECSSLLVPKLAEEEFIEGFLHNPYHGEWWRYRMSYNIMIPGIEISKDIDLGPGVVHRVQQAVVPDGLRCSLNPILEQLQRAGRKFRVTTDGVEHPVDAWWSLPDVPEVAERVRKIGYAVEREREERREEIRKLRETV